MDLRKINRRVLEALIKAGACDVWGHTRASLLEHLEVAIQAAEQSIQARNSGQSDLFGITDLSQSDHTEVIKAVAISLEEKILEFEKETLGYYFSGHPMTPYQAELDQLMITAIDAIPQDENRTVLLAGVVTAVRVLFNRRNEKNGLYCLGRCLR